MMKSLALVCLMWLVALSGVASAESLPSLVTQFEPCAVLCYSGACKDSGCSPTDLSCVCSNPGSLVVKVGICVGKACDGSKPFDAGDLIGQICNALDQKPPSSDIAAASSAIVSEISSASKSAAATATTTLKSYAPPKPNALVLRLAAVLAAVVRMGL